MARYFDEYDQRETYAPPQGVKMSPYEWANVFGGLTGHTVPQSALSNPRVIEWIQGQIDAGVMPYDMAKKMKMPSGADTSSAYNALYLRDNPMDKYDNLWDKLGGLGTDTTKPADDPSKPFYNTGYNFNPLGYGGRLRV